MATLIWRGDAQARSQITTLTPAAVEIGDILTVTINRKDISVTATAATVANVVALLVTAIGQYSNTIAEFAKVSASAGSTTSGGITTANTHVIVTGPADGEPFVMTTSTTDAGSGSVTVTTTTPGVAAKNEIQRVRLGGTPTGGTFTLTFSGETTAAIAYNATAAALVLALEALSNIGVGDVAVTETATSDWLVTFQATYAETDVPLMTGSGALLTGGGGINVVTTQQGGPVNEQQDIVLVYAGTSPSITLTFNGVACGYFTNASTAAQVTTALESAASIGAGNVVVTKEVVSSSNTTFHVTFAGSLGGANQPLFVWSPGTQPSWVSITEIVAGSTRNEKQQVTVTGGPTGGTFTLTFEGQTTAGIAYNAANAAVVTALEALSNIGVGDVAVTLGPLPNTAILVEFQALLASTDRAQMTGSGASLTGGSVNTSVTQEAVAGVNEVQTVSLASGTIGGTFTLTYSGQTTGTIAYDASAATVDTALEALSNIGVGDVTVTGGPGPSTAWVVTFTAALAKTDVAEMTGNGDGLTAAGSQTLTAATPTTATGPNNLNDAENYSTGILPTTGDTLVVDEPEAGDILWNLDALSAVTLAKLVVRQSFANKRIGLSDHNGSYYEYLPVELAIGATSIEIGNGDGSGPVLVRINTGAVQTALEVLNSGRSQDDSLKAVTWRGTHASNTAEILGGEFGAAVDQADLATLTTLRILASEVAGNSPNVFCGPGLTLATAEVDGGTALFNSAITALTVNAGEVLIRGSGAVAQLNVLGGKVIYNTSGALGGNTIVAGEGILDFSQDMSTKTITNPIEKQSEESQINDPNKVTSGMIWDMNYVNCEIGGSQLGRNRRITFGAPA